MGTFDISPKIDSLPMKAFPSEDFNVVDPFIDVIVVVGISNHAFELTRAGFPDNRVLYLPEESTWEEFVELVSSEVETTHFLLLSPNLVPRSMEGFAYSDPVERSLVLHFVDARGNRAYLIPKDLVTREQG